MIEMARIGGEHMTLGFYRTRSVVFGIALAIAAATGANRAQAAPNEAERSVAPDEEAKTTHQGAVFVDPLGFLLFGPTLGVELALGQFSTVLYGRWLSVGVLANSMFLNDNTKFEFSYGGGLKGRYYFSAPLEGPHLGVALEFLKSRTRDDVNRVAVNNLILVPELEGGYRLALGRFFLGGTAGVGYAQQIAKNVENINGGDQAQYFVADDVSTIYGSASVDVGLYF